MTLGPTRRTASPAVLVADDDAAIRTTVSDILRHEGYVVAEAEDGTTAQSLLRTRQFDALVLDDRMSELDGMAMLEAMDTVPPAVIMSADDVDSIGRKDLAVRGIGYLRKPVDPEHLLDAVATAVGRRRPTS
jgi:CheY-like chemotaxis protein